VSWPFRKAGMVHPEKSKIVAKHLIIKAKNRYPRKLENPLIALIETVP
jgi:hypothetical protein